MKVLGRKTSGNVQKVLFLLEELGADYSREDYGRQFGNTGSAEYLAMNPAGKVPTLVDGELTIWESHSILRYIAAKAGSALYPADLAARARIEPWMDWLLAALNDTYVAIFKASKGGESVPEAAAKTLVECLTLLEGRLARSPWLAGSEISLAEIALAPIVHRCLGFPVELPPLPALRAWHGKLAARPSFQKACSA
ncbi:glutathione S-transferase [Tistlia consotensis]|uniref:Glutathione S-transferase n=1 Tax=Tistlia consotensis USBA 355 TaxID=560819 RepID=A0A1Y6CDL5_9PROT|nr:glutathione S-transferase family protein [Tistlia consotensis]SMF57375.1 glutathione S-transferase [Tistlia consotensis USBA 355]SNR45631.1 glutathione S-transferase [Tistlia consotensis]